MSKNRHPAWDNPAVRTAVTALGVLLALCGAAIAGAALVDGDAITGLIGGALGAFGVAMVVRMRREGRR